MIILIFYYLTILLFYLHYILIIFINFINHKVFILPSHDLSLIQKTPNILETDYLTISTDAFNISLKINDIIKVSVPSTSIELTTDSNILKITGDNFKKLPITTEVYFDSDIYFSNSVIDPNVPKIWTKIITKNIYINHQFQVMLMVI